MLVDHLIDFKGCDHNEHVQEYCATDMSMSQFIAEREEIIFSNAPYLLEPDFALEERLPKEARIYIDEPTYEANDIWVKHRSDPLSHMTKQEWDRQCENIERVFTGGEVPKQLQIGKDDDISNDVDKNILTRGQVTIDIDSILALFTDLAIIRTVLNVCVTSNPHKNLNGSVHLVHRGIPIHHIPHFYLGSFGHDPKYELFVLLPELHNPKLKRTKANFHNHIPHQIHSEFMKKCFLPAVKEVLSPNEAQSWDFSYEVIKAKSTAASKEGNRYRNKAKSFHQEIRSNLDRKYIKDVWRICEQHLKREIRREQVLKAFRGFQFFINAKGYKHRLMANQFSDLMQLYKDEVRLMIYITLMTDRKELRT